MKNNNILHIMNYAANYRGNFIDSLEVLNMQLNISGKENIYVFFYNEQVGSPSEWIRELQLDGRKTAFLTKNDRQNKRILRSLIKENHVGIVHTHFISMLQFCMIESAIHTESVKLVMHFHNHAKPFSNRIKRIVREFIYRDCVMIGVSESVANGLRTIYPRNSVYEVDNAINFLRLDSYENFSIKKYAPTGKELVCLMFGFDYYRKGVDVAVKAIKSLIERGEKIVLLISLSTNEDLVVKKITGELGQFPSWIHILKARNDVATYYRIANVFLTPSREEGFCYSAVEAAYCGCRVIASKIPAQGSLDIPGALWFDSEDNQQLADRINQVYNEIDLKPANVEKHLMKKYDLQDWANQVISIYDEIGE